MAIGEVPCGTIVRIAPQYKDRKWSDILITADTTLTINQVIRYKTETYPSFRFEESAIQLNGLFLEEVK